MHLHRHGHYHDARRHAAPGPSGPRDRFDPTQVHGDRPLAVAAALNVLLTAVELAGGLLSGSLALIADALHNLNDAAAIGVALIARRIARRPADRRRTFGYRRAEVIGALINQTALVLVGLYLVYEALLRLGEPQEVGGRTMIAIGAVAFAVDAGTAMLTFALSRRSLNVRAAFVHNVADALGSIAVIAAGFLVVSYGWWWADLLATFLVAAYVIWQGIAMMREGVQILLEGAPSGLDLEALAADLASLRGVREAHHLHVWQLDEHRRALEVHLVVGVTSLTDAETIKAEAKHLLRERHGIGHSTIEIEPVPPAPGEPIQLERRRRPRAE